MLHTDHAETIVKLYGDSSNVRGHEKFARHLEHYFRTGEAPNAQLAPIFESIRQWMRQIYTRWHGGKPSAEITAIFDPVYGHTDSYTERLLEGTLSKP